MSKYFSIILLGVVFFFMLFQPTVAEQVKEEGKQNVFIYDDNAKRDPLMPLVTPAGEVVKLSSELTSADLILEGIMYAPNGNGIAMINGKLLSTKETIGPYTVQEIAQFFVILTKGSEKVKLQLKKGD